MAVKYYRKILQIIFLAGIIINPLLFWPWADIAYEIPKVWFVYRWVETLGLFGLIVAFFYLKKEKVDTLLTFLVILFCIFTLVSSFLGADFYKSLSGNYYRADGLFTLAHLIILFFFLTLFYQKEWLKPILVSISASSILASILTLADAFRAFVLKDPYVNIWDNALGSTFGNPNFLAGYLVVTLPFTFFFLEREKKSNRRVILFLTFCLQTLAILLTRSWSGLFGILVFFLILTLTKKHKNMLFIVLVITSLLASGLAFTLNYKSAQRPGIVIAEGRERIIKKALFAFQKRPLLGWGWANFDYAFESVDWPVKYEDDIYVDKAHSHFLEILVTTGILGLVLYVLIILKTAFNLLRKRSQLFKYLFVSFFLFILHSQTNVISVSEELLFWIILGISAKEDLLAS